MGNQSSPDMTSLMTWLGLTLPGQRMTQGTRKPPSVPMPFQPLNGVVPPSGQLKPSVPLSVETTTMVLSATPISSSLFITSPMMSSNWAMPASSMLQPFCEVRIFWYFGARWVNTCIRVGLSQMKNGLFASWAFFMKLKVCSRITSSTVSMFSLTPSVGWGGSGPSSTILCLPTLPQRGSTVGSSLSVAKQCSTLRGPTLSSRSLG